MVYRIQFLIACLFLPLMAGAQQFKSISMKEGLSANVVSDITEDHLGYMWFATQNGLDRFDGYDFKIYTLKGFGLKYNGFSYVAEDADGNVWVRSYGRDFYLYDRKNDRLSADYRTILQQISPELNNIDNLIVDSCKNLWISSGDKLYYYNFPLKSTSIFDISASMVSLASTEDVSYVSLSNGEIWQLRPAVSLVRSSSGRDVYSMLSIDSLQRLWAYFASVSYYKNGVWTDISPTIIPDNDYITSVVDDGRGKLWFATNSKGIVTSSYDLTEISKIENDYSNEFSLTSNHISRLYLSEDGLLWVATTKRGTSYVALDQIRLERFKSMISEDVGTIIQQSDGSYLVGFDGKGLWSLPDIRSAASLSQCGANTANIISSFAAADGSYYFSTYGAGVLRWKDGRLTSVKVSDPEVNSSLTRVRNFLIDSNGSMWFASSNVGVVCQKTDGQTVQFTIENSELASNSTTSMTYSAHENKVFVSTTESLNEIDCNTLVLKQLREISQIRTIYYDANGILWIGTAEGLVYIDRKRGSEPKMLTEGDGLSDDCIVALCSDYYGNLWATTANGITNIFIYDDPMTDSVVLHCYPYYEEDGIGEGHFTDGAIFCDAKGDVLMGCNGDIIRVIPEKYPPRTIPEQIHVTSISVSGNELPYETISSGTPVRMKSYDNLSVEVSSMDFQNRLRLRYEYRIDDESQWNTLVGNGLKLNSLSSGRHTIYIREKGVNPTAVDTVPVTVRVSPPFHRSLTAYLLYALGLALIFAFIWLRFKMQVRERMTHEKMEMDEMRMQFFTNVGHDLRTPLTMIISPMSRLLRESKGTPMEEDIEMIGKSANVLKDEINQLLDFKKIGRANLSLNPSYGDICRFVSEVSETFSSFFSDGSIKLVTDMPDSPVMMDFDRDKLQRILRNLLSNAFKFSDPGSVVTVSVVREGDNALVKVADTGRGISDESKSRVFDRFYQEGPSGKYAGSGIGLNIVKEFATLHGGTVSVTDNQPKGSIFTVSLPITENTKPDIPVTESDAETVEEDQSRPRILVVEDNELFRSFMTRSLSDAYNVVEAGDGKEALDQLANSSFDMVISDVMMPVMDGMELCKTIKNDIRYSHIPVILITAVQNEDVLLRSLKEGADEYITKPFDIEVLNLKIQKILSWSQENRRKWSEDSTLRASDIAISRLDKELMEKLTEAVEKNMSNSEFSIEELTQELGISRSRLYKKLTSITGKSPIEFIRVLRLKKAKQLLEEGETSVSQIAWGVGFSPKQFSKYFKDEYGCLPSEYIHHLTDSSKQ